MATNTKIKSDIIDLDDVSYFLARQPTSTGILDTINGVQSASVQKAGDTMTGPLVLAADPTDPMHPVTKQFSEATYSHLGHDHIVQYDIPYYIPGNMVNPGVVVGSFLSTRSISIKQTLASNFAGICKTGPASAIQYSITQNTNPIGNVSFAANATTATFTLTVDVTINPGDLIEIVTPNVIDSQIKDVTLTLIGTTEAVNKTL